MKRLTAALIFFLLISGRIHAQDQSSYLRDDSIIDKYEKVHGRDVLKPQRFYVSEEEVVKAVDKFPAFGVYRDTYFITGIPLNEQINRKTADVTFQLSIRQRLTKSVLPYNTFAYLTFTQKSFWNLYDKSSPFRDTNYNPGLGLGKSIFYKGQLVGGVFVQLMHESNGKEEEESRSWNYISLSGKYFFNTRINISAEVWIPYVDGENNRDLLDYRGLGNISANFVSDQQRWWFTVKVNPKKGFLSMNVDLSAGLKLSASANQYLFLRLFHGYGEGLLDYNKYTFNVRVGICIKPDFFSIY